MGPRSLRIQREKLQRARRPLQHDLLSRSFMPLPSNAASPTIFLSRASLDPSSPSPSPLAAAAGSQHHAVPIAEAVGGGVAGVVALVAAVAVIYRVFMSKVGLGCLLGPLCKLLSRLGGNVLGPFAHRLNSLRNKLREWTPASKRQRTSRVDDDDEVKSTRADDSRDMPDEVTDGSSRRAHRAEHVATAADLLKQLQIDGETFLVATVDAFVESELKKVDKLIVQPLSEKIAKGTQVYAESLIFSVAENISDDDRSSKRSSDAHPEQVSKPKANASDHTKASIEVTAAVHKPSGDEGVSMVYAGTKIEATSKTTNTIANENEVGRKRLKKVQEPVTLEKQVVLQRKQGKEPLTSNGENEIEIAEAEGKQGVHLNDGGGRSGQARIAQISASKEASAPSSPRKHKTDSAASGTSHSMSLVTTDTGGIDNVCPESGTILVPGHLKAVAPMAGRTMTSAVHQKWGEDDVRKAGRSKRKRPSNLGHVSFSCDISAHKLRFFTACKSGGAYGSPPASPADHSISIKNRNYYNHYHDRRVIRAADNYYSHSQPYTAHHVDRVPLYSPSHYNLMHQQHHPSQSILVQHNPIAPALPQHTSPLSPSLDAADNKSPSHRPPNLGIHDYGSPYDGVL